MTGARSSGVDSGTVRMHNGHMAVTAVSRKSSKRERVVARLSREDKRVISHAAAIAGQSLGRFIVAGARRAALETLESRPRIALNAAQSRKFVEALLAPPRPPTAKMIQAMREYKAKVKSDLD